MIKIDNIQWSLKVNKIKLPATAKNKNMLKLINSACDICENDIAHFPLPVTKIAWKTTLCALLAGNYIFKPSRRVPWNLFLFVRMNTFVLYHSALLAHFPHEDTKTAEELRGAPRESPHNRDFEETANLIALYIFTLEGDGLQTTYTRRHNNKVFSAYDKDNDDNAGNCARYYDGGWWYNGLDGCYAVLLTGTYSCCYSWFGDNGWIILQESVMMVRRKQWITREQLPL